MESENDERCRDVLIVLSSSLFYSCKQIDQTIFESLFVFSTYFVWITFYRQNFDQIRSELARYEEIFACKLIDGSSLLSSRLFRANHDMELLKVPISEVNCSNSMGRQLDFHEDANVRV